jgi:uncharacterized lipoprotein YmbA
MMHFKRFTAPLLVVLALGLGACSSTVNDLTYRPQAALQPAGSATVGSVTAIDERKEDPTRLATILGGFGNPLKTLDTSKPVKDEVADAFVAGLRARGILAASDRSPYRLTITVHKFDADMYMGRGARIDLTIAVLNQAGQTLYSDNAADKVEEFKAAMGIFADIEDLRQMCETLLDRTVDQMLDKPEFRAAVR